MNKYLQLLSHLRRSPKMLQSDYARANMVLIAEAASRGHISSLTQGKVATREWHVTAAGVSFLVCYGSEV